MVERGERPEFPTGAPEIEEAPDFSGGDRSSNPEHDIADLPSATPEITPALSVSSPESSSSSDGQLEAPSQGQAVGFKQIPKGEKILDDQDTVNAVFEMGAKNK